MHHVAMLWYKFQTVTQLQPRDMPSFPVRVPSGVKSLIHSESESRLLHTLVQFLAHCFIYLNKFFSKYDTVTSETMTVNSERHRRARPRHTLW
jgi:hypothetical protein